MNILQETASLITRDNIRLDADIYRPQTEEKLPVLLMRQPYGKAIASTVVYAHPKWYAQQGYIVVIQDVRGRGTSEGEFKLFTHEIEDGFDTVNWVAHLPYSNGQVGMYGFSYQGMTQIYAASTRPQALKTVCPAMMSHDLYADWAYEGGAFCLYANLGWAIQISAETARLKGNETAYNILYQASRNLLFFDAIPSSPEVLKIHDPDSFYHDWLAHDQPDEYWQNLSPKLENLDLPMLHIGGWFDTYLRGTIHFYQAMVNRSQHPQHLIIGPWAHLPWGRKVGGLNYGLTASTFIDTLQIQWFDTFLKGKENPIFNQNRVCLFEMGSQDWREFKHLPSSSSLVYYLSTNGLANLREDAGILTPNCPKNPQEDVFVHDPWRPVPALGGHVMYPTGSFDRSNLDCRSDIVTYTSEPLSQDLHLTGDLTAEIYCSADKPSFDLCAVLSEVKLDGSVYNFSQGYQRINLDNSTENSVLNREQNINLYQIKLQPTCIKIPQGHCLRLSVSAACFPAYPVNPGTGKPVNQTRLIDYQIITLTIYSGDSFPSNIRVSTSA
ncbi:Cocaine esterase [Planktothrix tepida]|uniref:Peptidase S15 n=1 Tax=Planktothrix tepida PCC 9214 TaxID=671072 RepID=A0A1J1LEE1_9CYAN|nr:CocE/NonD family hydrolase [Planktothrix tepida]CAD5914382.1 Cocaine esterase [Planktothrix tepida]CUR30550.1 Peptidase S15 [Planktothrix tepida PCC 9214]